MNSKIVFIVVFLIALKYSSGYSQQSMNDFSFIEVPEVYEFLEEKDEYQLNSLTKFLFNKNGFNAYFSNELPNVRKCEGLYADLETELGFIYTKIVVVVKDCNGIELFRSAEGRSKLKDYRQTYHQALRNAFKSFENLGVNQKELEIDSDSLEGSLVLKEKKQGKSSANENYPTARFSSYKHNGNSFLLRKIEQGYSLSQEVAGAKDDLELVGTIIIDKGLVKFVNTEQEVSEAYFDNNRNLIVKDLSGDKMYEFSGN
jgi:hypothetical protein